MDGETFERRDAPLRISEDVAVAGGGAMARLLGLHDENLEALEARYPVSLSVGESRIRISGPDAEPVRIVAYLLRQLAVVAESGHEIRVADVRHAMDAHAEGREIKLDSL